MFDRFGRKFLRRDKKVQGSAQNEGGTFIGVPLLEADGGGDQKKVVPFSGENDLRQVSRHSGRTQSVQITLIRWIIGDNLSFVIFNRSIG